MFVQCDFGGSPPGYLVVVTVEEGRRYRPTPEAAVRPSWIVQRLEISVFGDFGQRLAAACWRGLICPKCQGQGVV